MALTVFRISEYVNWKATGPTGWGGSSGGAVVDLSNYYTKTELFTPGLSQVDWSNIINEPNGLWEITEDSGFGNILQPIDISAGIDQMSLPFLPAADSSLTNVVMYDPITGFLSYGLGGGGDSLWVGDTNIAIGDFITPVDNAPVWMGNLLFNNGMIASSVDEDGGMTTALEAILMEGTGIMQISSRYAMIISTGAGISYAGIDLATPLVQVGYPTTSIGIISGIMYSNYPDDCGALHVKGADSGQPGDHNGGNLYLYGGAPHDSGLRGDIYFGDGVNGMLPEAESDDTYVVRYNPTTGKLSYGTP